VITPRLLQRFGVGAALTVLPLVLLATAVGFALTGALVAVILLELGDGGLRHSLYRVGTEILYLPIPTALRDGGKLIADAVSLRGGQAVAALVALAATSFLPGPRALGVVIAVIAVVWLVAIQVVRRAYVTQFRDMLLAGEIQRDVGLPALDAESVRLLVETLTSPDEVEALAALDLLERRATVPAFVLYHPRFEVVRRALALLHGELRPDVARVLDHLIGHTDPEIRAAALATSGRIGYRTDALVAALDDPQARVRAAAYVGLTRIPEHAPRIEHGIAELLAGSTADRVALASALEFSPSPSSREVLSKLLAHHELEVVRIVLRVLENMPAFVELDQVIPLLADAQTRTEARRVLLAVGPRALRQLIAALDDPGTPPAVRRHLPRTIGRFRSQEAAAALVARLPHEPDRAAAYKLLRALGRMCNDDPNLEIDPEPVRIYVRRAVHDAVRYAKLADRFETSGEPVSTSTVLIVELLAEKQAVALEHAFRGLGVLDPRAGLRSVHDALIGNDEGRRAAAREILEATVPAEVRVPLLALTDKLAAEERFALLVGLTPDEQPASEQQVFSQLLTDPSESLRCVVAFHVAERNLVTLRAELARLRPTIDAPLVRDAFDQAIARLDA
jgi:AAA family ATP:ADP antiporter